MYKGKSIEWQEIECKYPELGNCWEVTSHKPLRNEGYFGIVLNGVRTTIHRHVYEECFGEIPDGMVIMHKCDNTKCINPEHLQLGTHAENLRDRDERDRISHGEKHWKAKLTLKDVEHILNSNKSAKELAFEYQVDYSVISKIKRRTAWRRLA